MSIKTDNDIREKLTAVLEAGLSDDTMKTLSKAAEKLCVDIEDDVMYRLKQELAPNLSAWVADLAGNAVMMILEGNEEMMREYLSCKGYGWNGRSGDHNIWPKDIVGQHPIIHGRLFEQGCVKLRRDIVNAHRDLLVNERILDLEDQNKSLVAQVNKANAEKDAMWERCRGYLT